VSTAAPRFRRIYVWQKPVRLYHWVNAASIVVLASTGFVIGHPVAIDYSTEAHQQYWFGTVRFTHFVAAFAFFFNTLFRIYWGFVGNRWARWTEFIPTTRAHWAEILHTLKVDVFQVEASDRISLGHNALAGLTYFVSFLVFLFQAATGFALYASMSQSWLPRLFTWVTPILGSDFAVRQWHHAAMWFFVLFALVHVYLVGYHDYVEGRGTVSSMWGGWKFRREEEDLD